MTPLDLLLEAAKEITQQRRGYHGEMYGCVTCYHARKTEDRCAEGRIISAYLALTVCNDQTER